MPFDIDLEQIHPRQLMFGHCLGEGHCGYRRACIHGQPDMAQVTIVEAGKPAARLVGNQRCRPLFGGEGSSNLKAVRFIYLAT